jgi:hypothetical protein
LPGESLGIGDDDFVHVPRIYVRSASGTQKIHWILGSPSGAGNFAVTISGSTAWLGAITWTTFADGDATPDVSATLGYKTANTGATTITDFDNATNKLIVINFGDGNTTISHNANIKLQGGVPFVGATNDSMVLVHNGSLWLEVSRSTNS